MTDNMHRDSDSGGRYGEVAANYRNVRPTYPPELPAYLARLTSGHELAVDCGTGSGQAAVLMAAHYDQVIGVDISPEQLANAVQHPKVAYHRAKAEMLGQIVHPRSVDIATFAASIHWTAKSSEQWLDFGDLFTEMQRILKPGGVVAAWTYTDPVIDGHPAMNHLIADFTEVTGHDGDQRNQHSKHGYTRIPIERPGFTRIETPLLPIEETRNLWEVAAYLATRSSYRAHRKRTGVDYLASFKEKAIPIWSDAGPSTPLSVTWPMPLLAARVQ